MLRVARASLRHSSPNLRMPINPCPKQRAWKAPISSTSLLLRPKNTKFVSTSPLMRCSLSTTTRSSQSEMDPEKLMDKMLEVLENNPAAQRDLAKCFDKTTCQNLSRVLASNAADLNMKIPTKQYLLVMAQTGVPMIGFGFIDNFLMIVAGEYMDMTLGVTLGISTMAAAGLGNTFSDMAGVGLGGTIQEVSNRLGLPKPSLTTAQWAARKTRLIYHLGSAIGVGIGCLIGMVPLLFIDFNEQESAKREHRLNHLFELVLQQVHHLLDCDRATLFLTKNVRSQTRPSGSSSSSSSSSSSDSSSDSGNNQETTHLAEDRRVVYILDEEDDEDEEVGDLPHVPVLGPETRAFSAFPPPPQKSKSVIRSKVERILYSRYSDETNSSIAVPVNGNSIAGWVAENKTLLNVQDAQSDSRFCPDVDKRTGYVTKSVLCVPIVNDHNEVLGVVEVVNKKKIPTANTIMNEGSVATTSESSQQYGTFDVVDELLLQSIAAHIGLAVESLSTTERENTPTASLRKTLAILRQQRESAQSAATFK